MTDSRFDQIIRDKLEGYQIEVPDELWSGIERKMILSRRRKVALRVAFVTVAAACVAVGVIINVDRHSQNPVEALQSESSIIAETNDPVSVEPVYQQVKNFVPKAVAYSAPEVEADDESKAVPVEVTAIPESVEVAAERTEEKTEPVKVAPVAQNQNERPDIRDIVSASSFGQQEKTKGKLNVGFSTNAIASSVGNMNSSMQSLHAGSVAQNAMSIEQLSKSQYSFPLSFGIKANYDINDRFSVGLGINYSYLETSFDALVNKVGYANTSNQLHYIGLSLDGYYRFIRSDQFNVYAKAGAAFDKGVYQRYVYGSNQITKGIRGIQASVNAGVGAEWRAVKFLGLYVEPTISYYFDTKQPTSVHTEQPLSFGLSAGARFYLK